MADKQHESFDSQIKQLKELFARRDAERDVEYDRLNAEVKQQLKETSDQVKKTSDQVERTEAQLKVTSDQVKKTSDKVEDTSKFIKNLARQVGGLDNRWGKIVEDLVAGDLVELLAEAGIKIDHAGTRIKGTYQDENWEIDLLGENRGTVVPVEVKTTLTKKDIDDFIKRILNRFTQLMPSRKGHKVYGVIAYVKAGSNEENVISHALSKGLIIIKAMRGTNKLICPKDFKLRNFHP